MESFWIFVAGVLIGAFVYSRMSDRKSRPKEAVPAPDPAPIRKPELVEGVGVAAGEILDSLPDAVLLVDDAHFVRFANGGVRLRYPEAKLPRLGSNGSSIPVKTLLEVTNEHRITALVREVLEKGEDQEAVIEDPARQEPETFWRVHAALFAANQRRKTVRVLIHDITEEIRLDRVRRDFVSNASHELRTPLTMITGSFDALTDEDLPPSIRARMVDSGQRNAGRMARLIEDMLSLSQVENPEDALTMAEMSIRSMVDEVISQLQPLLDDAGAVVENLIPEDLPKVTGDAFYWEQVFYNLVENAAKYRRPDVPVKITLRFKTVGDESLIVVEDNGRGIPQRHLAHVFRRFFRAETSHSQHEAKGTGLGLAIVKRAVEAHGGAISVESELGEFTRLIIRLPQNCSSGRGS